LSSDLLAAHCGFVQSRKATDEHGHPKNSTSFPCKREWRHHDERGYVCPPDGQCVGAERTVGATTDIGAFEFGGFDRIFHDEFDID
jgi:hypothetical protein